MGCGGKKTNNPKLNVDFIILSVSGILSEILLRNPWENTEESKGSWIPMGLWCSAPPTALLQKIQVFYRISANYHPRVSPNFVHLHLREGKKNKKAAKWQQSQNPRVFNPKFCLFMEKWEFSPFSRIVLLEKSNRKMVQNKSFLIN